MEDLLAKLKNIGFNTYESKVYLSLLKHHPATGYEVSKESGVPQARAYDTLKVLQNRNIVVISGTKPITYIPISPHELLDRCENSFSSSVDFLREKLPNIAPDHVEPVLNIRGAKEIFENAKTMIESANTEIFLEIWAQDVNIVRDSLKKAHNNGVSIRVVGYDNVQLDIGKIYHHGIKGLSSEKVTGRWFILTVDNSNGIAGSLSEEDSIPHAVYTRHPGIVLIMKELIIHDIFLLEVEKHLGKEMDAVFGENLIKLREEVFGKDFKIKF